jgi:hypothetical protein
MVVRSFVVISVMIAAGIVGADAAGRSSIVIETARSGLSAARLSAQQNMTGKISGNFRSHFMIASPGKYGHGPSTEQPMCLRAPNLTPLC